MLLLSAGELPVGFMGRDGLENLLEAAWGSFGEWTGWRRPSCRRGPHQAGLAGSELDWFGSCNVLAGTMAYYCQLKLIMNVLIR